MIDTFVAQSLAMLAAIDFEHWCGYCGARVFDEASIALGHCEHHLEEWAA